MKKHLAFLSECLFDCLLINHTSLRDVDDFTELNRM
jgi:hypothetical protein